MYVLCACGLDDVGPRVCVYVHVDVVRMHTLWCICMYCRMRHIVPGYRHAHTFFTGFIM